MKPRTECFCQPSALYLGENASGVFFQVFIAGAPHPDSQGNWASNKAMAAAVVSWGGARRRMAAAGGSGIRARRARWLRP